MQLKFSFPAERDDRFGGFVEDERNREAARLCRAFVSGGGPQPKSLVLYGPPGAGKTHLLLAMGAVVRDAAGEGAALYLDAAALKERTLASADYAELKRFMEKYESAAYVAVDNLELAFGDAAAQEAVFHLYNAAAECGGRFAAALEPSPPAWDIDGHLKTRLLWGQVLRVEPVGDDRMVHVLVKMAKDSGFILPEEAGRWLVTRLPRDPQSLRGALERIDRLSLTTGRKVSINLVKEALE